MPRATLIPVEFRDEGRPLHALSPLGNMKTQGIGRQPYAGASQRQMACLRAA